MSKATENLQAAMERGMAVRPQVGGFPYLAEALRQAGIERNVWALPSAQSLFLTAEGPVVVQGQPLVTGMTDVAPFDEAAVVKAIRADQAGDSTFPEFLAACWSAGVVGYEVDFVARNVRYFGCNGEEYVEEYPEVSL